MANRRHDRRRAPTRHHHGGPDLLDEATRLASAGEPFELLTFASGLVAALDPRRADPLSRAPATAGTPRGLEAFVEALGGSDGPGAAALLACLARLAPDPSMRERVRALADARDPGLPPALRGLDGLTVTRAVTVSHVLGDGEDVMLELRLGLGPGAVATAAVYIDHDLGTVVKDAFVVPVELAGALVAGAGTLTDPDFVVADVKDADARARIVEAMALGDSTYPPYESATWPACQPLLEWALRTLPEGGEGYARAEWDDEARDALAEGFFASPAGRALDDDAHRDLLDALVWYKTDYGAGDPLRWSAVSVEIALDWLPRKVVGLEGQLALAPGLLRALIPYGHAERGIRHELTARALTTLDRLEPDFFRRVARRP